MYHTTFSPFKAHSLEAMPDEPELCVCLAQNSHVRTGSDATEKSLSVIVDAQGLSRTSVFSVQPLKEHTQFKTQGLNQRVQA